MVNIKYFMRGSGDGVVLTGKTYGELFDIALSLGAVKIISGLGELFYKIGGEFVFIK